MISVRNRLSDPRVLSFAFAVAVTLLLYGGSLTLPLYMDDVIYGRYAQAITLPELFYKLDIVPYYRPLSLAPWKLIEMVFGYYPPVVLHGINLVVQILNAWLIAWLTFKYTERWLAGFLACALYLLFPFNYQAIPWAAALGHLMALSGILIALAGFERLASGKDRYAILVAVGALIAVFSHEIGIVVLPVLVARGLTYPAQRRTRLVGRPVLLYWLIPVLLVVSAYVLIWTIIPKSGSVSQFGVSGLLENLLYLSQGLSFALAALLAPLFDSPHAAALVALSLTLLMFTIWLTKPALGRVQANLTFGLLWFGMAIFVPAALLSPQYVIDGPRLLLVASGGVAISWGILGLRIVPPREWRTGLRLVTWILLVSSLAIGTVFIYTRMGLHTLLAPLYTSVFQDVVEAEPPGETVTVNLPYWISYRDPVFPLGSEGITYLTTYIGFPDLVFLNTNRWSESVLLDREDLRVSSPSYWFGYAAPAESEEGVAQTISSADVARLLATSGDAPGWSTLRRVAPNASADGWQTAAFENGITVAYPAEISILSGTERPRIELPLRWSAHSNGLPSASPLQDTTPFVQVLCNDRLVGQLDGQPLGGAFPIRFLQPDAEWEEVRVLSLASEVMPEDSGCAVVLGLYSPADNLRVPLADSATGATEVTIPVR